MWYLIKHKGQYIGRVLANNHMDAFEVFFDRQLIKGYYTDKDGYYNVVLK